MAKWIDTNVPDSEVKYGCGQMAQAHNSLYCDFSNVCAAYGADYFADQFANSLGIKFPKQPIINRADFIKALDVYQRTVAAAAPESTNWNWFDTAEAFMKGEIAMMANWDENWAAVENPELSRVSGKVGYSIMPSGTVRSANLFGGSGIGISRFASEKEKEAAWLFITWATSPQTELAVFLEPEGGNVPPRQSLYAEDFLSSIMQQTDSPGDNKKLSLQFPAVVSAWQKQNIYYRPKIEYFAEIEQIIIEELRALVVDGQTPAATAAQMQNKILAIGQPR